MWRYLVLPAVCLLLCLSSCSKAPPTADDTLRLAMADLGQFVKNLPTVGSKPPKNKDEFIALEPMAPVAAEFIHNGSIVYLWGAAYVEGGKKVIAHQKEIATSGGLALLENGDVVQMTPEEFNQAPKFGS